MSDEFDFDMPAELTTIKRIPTIVLNRLSLFTSNEKGGTAKFTWCVRNGFIRITIYLGDEHVNQDLDNDTEKVKSSMISAPLTHPIFYALLEELQQIIKAGQEITRDIECINTIWKDGVPTNDTYVQGIIRLGKDNKGYWITAINEDKPIIRFYFDEHNWHVFKTPEGNLLDRNYTSKLAAVGYLKVLELIAGEYIKEDIKKTNKHYGYN